jgi:alkyl hydroperoxide reductase subunit F
MLDQNIKTQLKAYLERLESPIELVAALDDSDKAAKSKNWSLKLQNSLIKSLHVLMVKIHAVQVLVLPKR